METVDVGILEGEGEPLQEILDYTSDADRHQLRLRRQNIRDLRTLQKVILVEEDRVLNMDQVLSRVLAFYSNFVPYKEETGK